MTEKYDFRKVGDPLVRRVLEGETLSFTPDDPTPNSNIGFSVHNLRRPRASLKPGDAAFHPALEAAESLYCIKSQKDE